MPRSRKAPLFELGGQWIAREAGSPYFHRYWTEPGSHRTSRASLRTTDLSEAEKRLAEIVVKGAPKTINTPLSAVLLNYFEDRTDKLPSKDNARLAGRTLLAFWGATARVDAVTEAKQKQFAEWSIAKGHSLGYISRNLSVLSAALGFAEIDRTVVFKQSTMQDKWALQGKATAKRFTPSDDDLARVLNESLPENFWRWLAISLLTGGRPEAALQLTPGQRNRENMTLDLNTAGRAQNKKYRAVVREPRALTGWLDHWEGEMATMQRVRQRSDDIDISRTPYCSYASVESIQTAFERIRQRPTVRLPRLSAYSCRHKIATVMRRARIPKEEQDMQLGHARPEGYGEWEPDYLQGVADALDAWWLTLQPKVKARSLFAGQIEETERVRVLRAG